MAGDPASTPGPHHRDAKHRGSAALASARSPVTPWTHPCGPRAGREHSESGPTSHCKPQACPALLLGWGGTGEAPLRHFPQPPELLPRSQQAQTLPHSHRGAGALPGQGDTRPHPRCPAGTAGSTATGSPSRPQCQGCALPLLRLHGTAVHQPHAGKWWLPSPPTRDAQPEASRAWSTAHSSQALTDRQTDVGRLQPFLLLQHGRTRGAWTQTKYFLKSCST